MTRASIVATTLAALMLPTPAVGAVHDCMQTVYWPLVSDGAEYRRVAYPVEAGDLRVLADTDFVLDARQACVRYWPITREYLADLTEESAAPPGRLEIFDASGEKIEVFPESFVLWHPKGVGAGPVTLLRGNDAERLHSDYVRKARASAERIREYERLVAQHQAAIEAWLRIAAERPRTLPKPPPELDIDPPEPYRAFATEPRSALVLSLPKGSYTVRILGADGRVVEGSERRLLSFAPLDESVGYVLRPEDRWTRPIVSFSNSETIYTTGGVDLFLQPVPVVEYEARHFARLFRPQTIESTDASRTVWVPLPGRPTMTGDVALSIHGNGDDVAGLPIRPYRVRQLPGLGRGYEIEEFEPGQSTSLSADFDAIRLSGEALPNELALVATGAEVSGSRREIRTVALPFDVLLFLPAMLPVGVALVFRLYSRMKGRAV